MIDDPKSARVKGVVRLHQKDARSQTGLFLLEGPQGLKELVREPDLALEVFATGGAFSKFASEFESLRKARVEIIEVSEAVLEKMADTQNPQGVVAVLKQLDVDLADLLETSPVLVAVLEQVRDPGNAGTVIRAADASGADGVVLTKESVDLYNSKLVRSTAGSLLNIPTVSEVEPRDLLESLRAAGMQIYVADAGGDLLTDISREELAKPTAWVFGNEAHGVSALARELSDRVVALPIYGSAESLNLATAASVCLYASAFAQRATH